MHCHLRIITYPMRVNERKFNQYLIKCKSHSRYSKLPICIKSDTCICAKCKFCTEKFHLKNDRPHVQYKTFKERPLDF